MFPNEVNGKFQCSAQKSIPYVHGTCLFFLTDSCLASRVDRAQLESEVRIDVAVRNGLLQAQRGQKAAEASLGCRLNGWEILHIASLICLIDAWDWQLAHGKMLISLEDHSEARMLCSCGLWTFEVLQLPFLTCGIGHLFCVNATCLRSNEAFGLVYAGKSTRVKVWRKRGGWILTAFCMTFWYSNAIQTTYYCIHLEGMTVACIQSPTHIHQKWYLHSGSMHADLLSIACHRQASSTWGEL